MIQKTFIVDDLSCLDNIAEWIIAISTQVGKPEDQKILVTVCVSAFREDL